MSREDFKSHVKTTTVAPAPDKVTVGAGIVRNSSNKGPQVLLLKRNASEASYPNVFEMPGGKVDATDSTIRDALVREVAEETQLTVVDVKAPLSPIAYTTEKRDKNADGVERVVKRHAFQLSYIVSVQGDGSNFRVNKDEHSEGIWADRGVLDGISITPDMKKLVCQVLEWAKENCKENPRGDVK
ncbi:hypothetical protein C8034_v006006 [Colletotrichum sidae]|uniref:Nudix hydrolase domain-containing protein n=1 Tax=Colletotrichum sidae TaxID=1347389 RepID=A0A4R8T4X0_9PEZI|nr:hypothetical protein C8034_v006006 [Colletotrichum sidae]